MQSVLELSLSRGADDIVDAADALDTVCLQRGIPPRVAFELNLAIDELVTNTLSYGFSDGSPAPDVKLVVRTDDEWVEAVLTDNGRAYDPFAQAPPPVLDADLDDRPIGGLGVYFVKQMMTAVEYHRLGDRNMIVLRRRFGDGAPG